MLLYLQLINSSKLLHVKAHKSKSNDSIWRTSLLSNKQIIHIHWSTVFHDVKSCITQVFNTLNGQYTVKTKASSNVPRRAKNSNYVKRSNRSWKRRSSFPANTIPGTLPAHVAVRQLSQLVTQAETPVGSAVPYTSLQDHAITYNCMTLAQHLAEFIFTFSYHLPFCHCKNKTVLWSHAAAMNVCFGLGTRIGNDHRLGSINYLVGVMEWLLKERFTLFSCKKRLTSP